MTRASQFAAHNPRAVVEGLENAIGSAWRLMHKYRKLARGEDPFGDARRNAIAFKYELRQLLAIRRGDWS